jgi:parallel beta-helix repeat protein
MKMFQFCLMKVRRIHRRFPACGLLLFIMVSVRLVSQPSGGPYGPVQQTYDLPVISGNIYFAAPDGKAENSGETLDRPTTLEHAIASVSSGDAIILRGGVYRTGDLILNQGIILQPYRNERPVLKGTMIAAEWTDLRNGLWKTSWPRLFPQTPESWWRRNWEGKKTPLHRFNNDMVFIDGKFLQSAGWEGEVDENSYYIDYDTKEVFIGTDPADRLVEITAYNVALLRTTGQCHGKVPDRKGPVIRGITFTQYAYRALEVEGKYPEGLSPESQHGKDVIGTTLEHCEITHCSRVAAYLKGDSLVIRHCRISDTSTEGIYIISSSDVLLEKNIFTRNNIEQITGYYPAAVKIFNQCYRVTCRDNLVIDLPYSNGIWYDVGNVDGVFINNWVQDVGFTSRQFSREHLWPSDNGFYFEISKGAVCAGNVFVNCDQGICVYNSSNVQILQNTMVNSTVSIGRTPRSAEGDHFGWHPSTGPAVDEREGHVFVNNLMTAGAEYNRALLVTWQTSTLCDRLKSSQLKTLDHNVYVREPGDRSYPLILWSPAKNSGCLVALGSLEEFRKLHPEFSANSLAFPDYRGYLFKGAEVGNYAVLDQFPGLKAAIRPPDEILKLLGKSEADAPCMGAYPPVAGY